MLNLVTKLLATEADLVVTVTAPLDRQRPNNDRDRITARNLLAAAKTRVQNSVAGDTAKPLLSHLDDAFGRIEFGAGELGYIVVATAKGAETHMLSFPVAEAITLANTPATRSLIQGLRRSPRYRILVVSDKATRLFEAVREDVWEVNDHGFPFAADVVPRDLRATAGRFARQPAGDDKEQWRSFYRDVDEALTLAISNDPLPLVLAGVDVTTAMFDSVSANTSSVIGRISGGQEDATTHTLGAKAWPLLRDHLKARRREVITELTDTHHAQKAVVGIEDAWRLAREGRSQMLVVEEDYRAEPALEIDHYLVATETGEPGVMEDPVDELIEHVVRSGGTVEFVATDALAHLGRVGLILR